MLSVVVLSIRQTADIVTINVHLGMENVRGEGVWSMHWPDYSDSGFLVLFIFHQCLNHRHLPPAYI